MAEKIHIYSKTEANTLTRTNIPCAHSAEVQYKKTVWKSFWDRESLWRNKLQTDLLSLYPKSSFAVKIKPHLFASLEQIHLPSAAITSNFRIIFISVSRVISFCPVDNIYFQLRKQHLVLWITSILLSVFQLSYRIRRFGQCLCSTNLSCSPSSENHYSDSRWVMGGSCWGDDGGTVGGSKILPRLCREG